MGPEAILLIILLGDPKTVAGIEFSDLRSCQMAEVRIKKELAATWTSSAILCLPKGSKLTVERDPKKP